MALVAVPLPSCLMLGEQVSLARISLEHYRQQGKHVAKGSGKVRSGCKEVSRGKVLRLHTVFRVLTQSEDLVSSLHSIYSGTGS